MDEDGIGVDWMTNDGDGVAVMEGARRVEVNEDARTVEPSNNTGEEGRIVEGPDTTGEEARPVEAPSKVVEAIREDMDEAFGPIGDTANDEMNVGSTDGVAVAKPEETIETTGVIERPVFRLVVNTGELLVAGDGDKDENGAAERLGWDKVV